MGLSPSRGGPLPHPHTHLSLSLQDSVPSETAGKMAAAAPCSDLLRGSPAARSHLKPSARGERPQKRISPQEYNSGAPGAPRRCCGSWFLMHTGAIEEVNCMC
ncbi:hypothetical protein NDU88_011397 [Pleurodeles waltl]|uniref:Uncharacterized protein n=1 Tax=Pleurodeles waltl TaxID=8319 RepID=A0AAV7R0V7_PLEWA|nr:hypothetical protein NDU88_011397 [Pleurodeles waltl]